MELMTTETNPRGSKIRHYLTEQLLNRRPQALVEADPDPERPPRRSRQGDDSHPATRDPQSIGGYLDRDLPDYETLSPGK